MSRGWEKVLPRQRPRASVPLSLGLGLLGTSRYKHRNSFRTIGAAGLRAAPVEVSQETARGYVQSANPHALSRGLVSGKSLAEVALAHISGQSAARWGGVINNRRSPSQHTTEQTRLRPGIISYAAAVSGLARGAAFGEANQAATESPVSRRESEASISPPRGSAVQSPFPIEQPEYQPMELTPKPAYQLPRIDHKVHHSASDSNLYHLRVQYSQENEGPSSNLYPRLKGPVPLEETETSISWKPSYSRQRYSGSESPTSTTSIESSIPAKHSDHYIQDLYTGDWSGQQPSVAETKPLPRHPDFNPRISPIGYEVYERMRHVRQERATPRRGSGLESSRLRESEEWIIIGGPDET